MNSQNADLHRVFTENVEAIGQNIARQKRRIHELETALNRMVQDYENLQADTEGKYPQPDCGCVYCTQGTVPDKLNTGPCAYHNAKQLLGQL